MFNTTFDEDRIICQVLSLSERHGLHDAKEASGVFLIASQQGGRNGIRLSPFHQIMTLGVLHAAQNAGLDGATEAVVAFERAKSLAT